MRVMFAKSDDRPPLVAGRAAGAPPDRTGAPADRRLPGGAERGRGVVDAHVQVWRDGRPTPVGPDLDVMLARWRALRPGDELMVEWPTRRLPSPAPRARRTPAAVHG